MLKTLLLPFTVQLLLLSSSDSFVTPVQPVRTGVQTGTLQKMMLAQGSVTLELDVNRLNGVRSRSQTSKLRFGVAPESFFTILVYNDALRGPMPGTMALVPQNFNVSLPPPLNAVVNQLVLEKTDWNNPFEWVIRDSTTGFVYFNIEGLNDDYDSKAQVLSLKEGRLLVSKEFAAKLGRPSEERSVVGMISLSATMRAIEITQVVNGEAKSAILPAVSPNPAAPTQVSGPDVIVGDLPSLVQSGSSGTQVGLAVATTSCNLGSVELDWFQLPNNDHPVIPQNLYRMSGGANNNDRFEQIGQSWLKHAFNALQETFCSTCTPAANGTHLGAGCSDPYTTSLNGSQSSLGSRAWVNPFTGFFPGSSPNPNDHTGHTHTGTSHRILVEVADLDPALNPGATYYAEAQYVTPHEYAWCQAHPGQCNMYNNASYRRFNVSSTGPFTFSAVGSTQQTMPAITGWPGASEVTIEPAPGIDGTGIVAYKVTNPSPGVWHYEYAVYNQNLDRGIQSFSVPLPAGINISNIGFHAPLQPAAFANDGTVGGAGFSSAPWTVTQAADSLTWSSETFATNQNANAIRWGTLYNFRFDADRPPQTLNATVGFFKTGSPISAQIQGPGGTTVGINDVAVVEGNSGTRLATFAVTLSAASSQTITVQYATADNSASAGSDYVSTSGTLTFNPGQTSQPVSVTINGDTTEELNETYFVNLSNAVNAPILDGQGVGTITNDDFLATLPPGFIETQIPGLSNPTTMALHPDGRIFVSEQTGALRVIKNGALLPTPFTTLAVNSSGERGLLGVAFDPNYASNRFVYVYYTTASAPIHNRVSRFTANSLNEDVAVVGSETVLLDLNNLSGATNHNGGSLHFGPDGKLYIAVGENANSANSQTLSNVLGKVLRMNADGSIPADNPFFGTATGQNRLIWALGLRNPFTFSFQAGTGRMHINDVGENTWEEINNGVAGANYGWPTCEGTCGIAGLTDPIYKYSNDASTCAITGGDFYNPLTSTFPAQFLGKYFFADFCGGWIKTIDPLNPPATGGAADFITGIASPVDIHVARDGSLYYLTRGTNSVFRVQYTGGPALAINDVSITEGDSGTSTANFTVNLSPASAQTVTVQYATANNTALANTDYVAASGTLTFSPGQTSQPVSVTINGDTTFEPNETFNVNLSSPVNATIGDAQGVGTILNDDPPPSLSINDVSVAEGDSGTVNANFAVTLSSASTQTVTVQYATANGTASSGSDYVSTSGTLTFAPGQTSQPVTVVVNGDTLNEANETFFVNLSNATNASITDAQATGTITNDDPLPSLSIDDVSVIEGNAGTTAALFTASLSAVSGQTVTVNFSTADGTANSSSDYIPLVGTLTFAPGFTSKTFVIGVNGDTTVEPDETFFVNLSAATNALIADTQGQGTIVNDDFPAPAFEFTQANFDNPEGTSSLLITVKRTGNPAPAASVDFQTNDSTSFVECDAVTGIANQRCDYLSTNGTLLFGANEVEKSFRVIVYNDVYQEGNETIGLSLTNPSTGTSLGPQSTATITILDDDNGAPTTNPIDGSQFFVQQHYFDFLQRTPDQAGLDFWVGSIESCGADPVCVNNRRIAVSDAFFFEPEYQQTAAYVVRLYRIAFGNNQPFPNPSTDDLVEAKKLINYSVFARDRARVVGGSNLAQAQLDLANAFVLRPEFLTKYPASLTGPQFVDAVLATIQNDLGVDMNSQRTALINLFDSGGRENVLFRLSDDDASGNPINNRALIDAEYNRTFVFTEYAGYLRRNADINGFKFWLGQVNAFPVRNVNIQHAMVCSFITSQEYQQRFSSVVTRTNASCQ